MDSAPYSLFDFILFSAPYSTVFAPDNSAFAAYLRKTGLTAEELLTSPALKTLLANHVIQGKFSAADVLAMELPVEVATLTGAMLKIERTVLGGVFVGGQRVDRPDIMSANGVIHGIGGVITETGGVALMPIAETGNVSLVPIVETLSVDSLMPIAQTLNADPDFATLLATVSAAGLDTDLAADEGNFTVGRSLSSLLLICCEGMGVGEIAKMGIAFYFVRALNFPMEQPLL